MSNIIFSKGTNILVFILFIILLVFVIFRPFSRPFSSPISSPISVTSDTFSDTGVDDSVDVVYTWVNTLDPQWVALKNKHLGILVGETDNTHRRWINTKKPWDEIGTSIESVRTYLPWVRNIYVVTQRPQQLPKEIIERFRVLHVYHDEIFPEKDDLPVFSSQAIETCLHRIPGLANKFIYLNDDTYISNYMKKSDFFYKELPIARTFMTISDKSKVRTNGNIHNSSLIENSKHFGDATFIPIHQATPMTKELMYDTENEFSDIWKKTRLRKFRMVENIIPVYLAINYGIRKDKVKRLEKDLIRDIFTDRPLRDIGDTHMVCYNNLEASDVGRLRNVIFANKKNKTL